jgi:lysophospholipase L1-like esterase
MNLVSLKTFIEPAAKAVRSASSLCGLLACLLVWASRGSCATYPPKPLSVSQTRFYFSPYNTYSDGTGRLLGNNIREGSSYAMWVNPGAYFKTAFTGTSAILNIELTGPSGGQLPKVRWSIDGGPFVTTQLQHDRNAIPLASGLAPGSHSILFVYSASDANMNRWQEPVEGIKIYSILLDPGGTLVELDRSVAQRPKNIVFFGDSITEGAWVLGNSDRRISGKYVDWVSYSDAFLAWPRAVAAALDAEYGVCAFGGTSWIKPTNPFVPELPQSWHLYFADHSRLSDGKLLPRPDYVIVNMGTNDGDKDTSTAVASWLRQVRSAVDPKTAIVVIIPFGQMNKRWIDAALSSVGDLYVYKVDLGPQWADGLAKYGRGSFVSFDGLHPNAEATAEFAAALTAAIVRATEIEK